MARVNPPKQLVLPPEVANNKQLKKAFDDLTYIVFQLYQRTGGDTDLIDESNTESVGYNSFLQAIQKQVDGLPVFTIDTTGFTFDSTKITFDKVIA